MKLNIVKIGDKYALRKGRFFHEYLDMKSHDIFWWYKGHWAFSDCLTEDYEKLKSIKDNFKGFKKSRTKPENLKDEVIE